MAFENLSEKLQNVFKNLKSKGRLTEADIDTAMKEVKMALLEADVNFKVVKQFINSVKEKAIGEDVMQSLTPGQMVIKIVNEELTSLMGGEAVELQLLPGMAKTIIMMVGLQGSGKTTTAAKLAGLFKKQGKRPLLVGCDIYRPAAIEQLKINGERVGVPVFEMGTDHKAVDIAKAGLQQAVNNNNNVVIIDTAGRLQIDEDMMEELEEIKSQLDITYTLLVVDAMTGQDAVNIAAGFKECIGVDGVILTKLDGDTRGGSALSVRQVTQVPIMYAGMGEKLTDLEVFHPGRMASRILGMGDVLSLIEKAEQNLDAENAEKLAAHMRKNEFTFEDYLISMQQMRNMGGLGEILKMMPGLGLGNGADLNIDDKKLTRIEAIIYSMTPKERSNPKILNPSRKNRIAKGAGVDIAEVNRLVKQFEQMKQLMKKMGGMKGKKGRRGLGGLGGMMGLKGLKGLKGMKF